MHDAPLRITDGSGGQADLDRLAVAPTTGQDHVGQHLTGHQALVVPAELLLVLGVHEREGGADDLRPQPAEHPLGRRVPDVADAAVRTKSQDGEGRRLDEGFEVGPGGAKVLEGLRPLAIGFDRPQREGDVARQLLDDLHHLRIEHAGLRRVESENGRRAAAGGNRGGGERAVTAPPSRLPPRGEQLVGQDVGDDHRAPLVEARPHRPVSEWRLVLAHDRFGEVAVVVAGPGGGHDLTGCRVAEADPGHAEAAVCHQDPAGLAGQAFRVALPGHGPVDLGEGAQEAVEQRDALLGRLSLAHVADDREEETLSIQLHEPARHLDGNEPAVASQVTLLEHPTGAVSPGGHPHPDIGSRPVRAPLPLGRGEVVDVHAEQLAATVPVELFRPTVDVGDPTVRPHEEDRVGRLLEQEAESGLAPGEGETVQNGPLAPQAECDPRRGEEQPCGDDRALPDFLVIRREGLVRVDLCHDRPGRVAKASGRSEDSHPSMVDALEALDSRGQGDHREPGRRERPARAPLPLPSVPQRGEEDQVGAFLLHEERLPAPGRCGLRRQHGVDVPRGVDLHQDGSQRTARGRENGCGGAHHHRAIGPLMEGNEWLAVRLRLEGDLEARRVDLQRAAARGDTARRIDDPDRPVVVDTAKAVQHLSEVGGPVALLRGGLREVRPAIQPREGPRELGRQESVADPLLDPGVHAGPSVLRRRREAGAPLLQLRRPLPADPPDEQQGHGHAHGQDPGDETQRGSSRTIRRRGHYGSSATTPHARSLL